MAAAARSLVFVPGWETTFSTACMQADVRSLKVFAGIHEMSEGFHRMLAKRFPYAIYYRVEAGSVAIVYRVLDCRQNPAKTKQALQRGSS